MKMVIDFNKEKKMMKNIIITGIILIILSTALFPLNYYNFILLLNIDSVILTFGLIYWIYLGVLIFKK
jgi:hypothetical protein